jgi:plasmid stability protein
MATLHVRNVPDDLYELLRERAAENDRSIGAETVQLLQERLNLGPTPPQRVPLAGFRRRSGSSGRFTHFTGEARQAVVVAQQEARALGHDRVATEHLLLGVLTVTPRLVDLSVEDARSQLIPGDAESPGQIPFSADAKETLELALRDAQRLGCDAIMPANMLHGILGAKSGKGAELLRAAKPDEERLRRSLFVLDPSFRVVPLEGDAEAWEQQLNDAAAVGFQLVQIVDRRAILRR